MTTSTRWTTRPSTKSSRQIGAVHSPPFGSLHPLLDKADGAVVVNISSVSAVTGQGSNVAYCASKAALDSMTRSLGKGAGPIGARCVGLAWVGCGRIRRSRCPLRCIDAQREATPLERLATPDDVARAVSAAGQRSAISPPARSSASTAVGRWELHERLSHLRRRHSSRGTLPGG